MKNPVVKNFTRFEILYKSVSTLIKSLSYIDSDSRNYITSLLNLARKMEVTHYIQQKNIIAVAGMQGAGKSSLIRALYDLPQNILPIGSERGERNPIFIIESADLKPGEYSAKEVYFDSYGRYEDDIAPEKIASRSKKKNNVAYIELLVPEKYFTHENSGFVLLPGFEKNTQREFDSDYNSIMDYTLHFANAVILATDGSGIANEEIDVLVEKLGKNFNPSNCIFAITKCDTVTSDEEKEEMKESLLEACSDRALNITCNQIVSTGVYADSEENDKWIEKLIDSINMDGLLNYDSAKRSFLYYKPMVEEMLVCADEIESSIRIQSTLSDTSGPIYDDLKLALQDRRTELENFLEKICLSAQKKVMDKFVEASKTIPSKCLTTKKFLVFKKKYSENAEDKRYISKICYDCLVDETNTSVFISEIAAKIGEKDNRIKMIDGVETALAIEGDGPQSEQKNIDKYVRYHLVSTAEAPSAALSTPPDTKAIAAAVSKAFSATFCVALTGNIDVENVGFNTKGIDMAIKDIANAKGKGGKDKVTALALLDMLDGKSDIAEALGSVLATGGAEAATAATTVLGVAAIAVIVGIAVKSGIDIYNSKIEEQNKILTAWEYALKNSITEQCNNCLDIFDEGSKNLLEHVQKIHRDRMKIGDIQRRTTDAMYAIADVRDLANRINDEYADTLVNKNGE